MRHGSSVPSAFEAFGDCAYVINLSEPESRVYDADTKRRLKDEGITIRERRTAVGVFSGRFPNVRGFADVYNPDKDIIEEGGESLFFHRLDVEPCEKGKGHRTAVPIHDTGRVALREQLLSLQDSVPKIEAYNPPRYYADAGEVEDFQLNTRILDTRIAKAIATKKFVGEDYPVSKDDGKVLSIDHTDEALIVVVGDETYNFPSGSVPIVKVGSQVSEGTTLAQPVDPRSISKPSDLARQLSSQYGGREPAIEVLEALRRGFFMAQSRLIDGGKVQGFPIEYLNDLSSFPLFAVVDWERCCVRLEDLVAKTDNPKVERNLYSTIFMKRRDKK